MSVLESRLTIDEGRKALEASIDFSGKYGMVASVPIIAYSRALSSDKRSTLWTTTFSTSTTIYFDKQKGKVTVNHGIAFPPLRKIADGCEITLTSDEESAFNTLIAGNPQVQYEDLIRMGLSQVP